MCNYVMHPHEYLLFILLLLGLRTVLAFPPQLYYNKNLPENGIVPPFLNDEKETGYQLTVKSNISNNEPNFNSIKDKVVLSTKSTVSEAPVVMQDDIQKPPINNPVKKVTYVSPPMNASTPEPSLSVSGSRVPAKNVERKPETPNVDESSMISVSDGTGPTNKNVQTNGDENSLNVDENSLNVDENSPNIGDNSPNIDENSPNVGDNSPIVDENSPIDENSPNIDENSPIVDENSPIIDENFQNIEEKSPNLDENYPNKDDISTNDDETMPNNDVIPQNNDENLPSDDDETLQNLDENKPAAKTEPVPPIYKKPSEHLDEYVPNDEKDDINFMPDTNKETDGGLVKFEKKGNMLDDKNSHFFAYLLTLMVMSIIFYLLFHNKQRIIALIIEGRSDRSRRGKNRAKYHKLDNNLEEVMTSTKGQADLNDIY